MREKYYSIGTIIIDDIRLPDGTEKIGVLGGGLTHAVMGMRIWTENVGLLSGVGEDFIKSYLDELDTLFDVSGLIITPKFPTPRASQVFDPVGTRHESFQTEFGDMRKLLPQPEELSQLVSKISGVHLHCPPQDVPRWTEALRQRHCDVILWEPWDGFCQLENQDSFREYCSLVDIVSPNLLEGQLVTGLIQPEEVVLKLKRFGTRIAVLRMGEKGSLIADETENIIHIPAYPVRNIIDVTGAGNAYCGGFIVGFFRTKDPVTGGWYGAVSASFTLQQFGALYPLDGIEKEAGDRLRWYQQTDRITRSIKQDELNEF